MSRTAISSIWILQGSERNKEFRESELYLSERGIPIPEAILTARLSDSLSLEARILLVDDDGRSTTRREISLEKMLNLAAKEAADCLEFSGQVLRSLAPITHTLEYNDDFYPLESMIADGRDRARNGEHNVEKYSAEIRLCEF